MFYVADWKPVGPVEARETVFTDGTFGPLEIKEYLKDFPAESHVTKLQEEIYGWHSPLTKVNSPYRGKGMEQFAGKTAESRGHDHADRMYTPFLTYGPPEG